MSARCYLVVGYSVVVVVVIVAVAVVAVCTARIVRLGVTSSIRHLDNIAFVQKSTLVFPPRRSLLKKFDPPVFGSVGSNYW